MSDSFTLIVPVGPSATIDETVEFAVDRATARDGHAVVYLVRAVSSGRSSVPPSDRRLLDRVASRARSRSSPSVTVRTDVIAEDQYLASPSDHADALLEYAIDRDVDLVVLDPNYAMDATVPSLQPIEPALAEVGLRFEHAPVSADHGGLDRAELVRGAIVFGCGYAFYLALGDPRSPFDLFTGAVAAVLAAALLRNVAFETTPVPTAAPLAAVRAIPFVPYLLWEIAKANAQFAYVVLHPSLPIDPSLDRIDASVGDGLSVTAFANSLTLTPGTLTVDAAGSELLVHSLTPDTREDLLAGGRERAIRFVFYGRDGLDVASPRDRGDSTRVIGPSDGSPDPTSADDPDGPIAAEGSDDSTEVGR